MRNYPELPILILAVAALGAVAVPMNAWWSEQELAYGLKDCGARVVFADGPRHQRYVRGLSPAHRGVWAGTVAATGGWLLVCRACGCYVEKARQKLLRP